MEWALEFYLPPCMEHILETTEVTVPMEFLLTPHLGASPIALGPLRGGSIC